jgi:adenylyltransferase/sulfurtransferase
MTDTDPATCNWEITPSEVARLMKDGEDLVLIDCRTPEEYEAARIAGAMLVPLQELSVRVGELRQFEERPIVVHCHKGKRSMTVTAVLRELGFENVRSMSGGIHRWSEDVDPSVPKY